MARLGAKQKKGFYAFPPYLIPHVTKWIQVKDVEKTAILDPCAGEGEAILELGQKLGIPSPQLLCSEVDEERGEVCMAKGMPTIVGDSIGDSHFPIASMFWLNPPYDVDISGRRMEYLFLNRLKRFLRNMGLLVFIVPFHILQRDEFKGFPDYFKHIRVLLFPQDDDPFKQCVVFALKNQGKLEAERTNWKEQLANPGSLLDAPEFRYIVPEINVLSGDALKKAFYSRQLTDKGILRLMNEENKDLFGEAHRISFFRPATGVSSLMPLRTGHQALALAAGAFDGAYRDPKSGNTLVILGRTTKSAEDVTNDEDKDKGNERVRSMPKPEVFAWDLTESASSCEVVLYSYI